MATTRFEQCRIDVTGVNDYSQMGYNMIEKYLQGTIITIKLIGVVGREMENELEKMYRRNQKQMMNQNQSLR